MQDDLQRNSERINLEQKEIRKEMCNIEQRITVNEKDISALSGRVEKISTNIIWLLRIVVGAVIMGILGLIINGGV
ncbi:MULTISPECIES: hypothetical protein [Bacillus cereus group]|uniref:XpaF1 protein n=1 Tax=Bacillus cereus TaxID=1396 RepID=A0AA44Q8Q0_BACCE|nr:MULTISPECIES: hypothetical protein [Bacillus cereus group]EEL51586.1 hypothetical protein bcere0022_9810 [Bacillus cereus Rock3-44]PFA22039.1 hypothetical protein CN373_11400 [Bacillus cereus]PFN09058.1 hypothetical protein COJ55_04565 [Bacillus cereus]PFO78980.1 hypothetical protein COJ77_20500 [Bacillus cereus]PFR29038.1 hypothetical protein COK19_07260 [Bacillus cereus]